MADDAPGRPPVGPLVAALRVRRNLLVGAAVGASLAISLYVVRVFELFGPAPDQGSPALFLALAFVLAVSAGGLVAVALTLATAVRVARDPDASVVDDDAGAVGSDADAGDDDARDRQASDAGDR